MAKLTPTRWPYSVLSCYLVSSTVIVTRESTSSVVFPTQGPLGVRKFISLVGVKPFLLRAGVLLTASSAGSLPPQSASVFSGGLILPPL